MAGSQAHADATRSSRRASRAGWRRSTAPSPSSSPTRSRATRSATTPTRSFASIRGGWTTRSSLYQAYEKFAEGRPRQRLRAQGPVPAVGREAVPAPAAPTADVRDVGKAAKDWPQLNFIIYHSAYRFPGGGTRRRRLGAVRADGPHRVGDRSRRDPRQARRHQRLRRSRPDLRAEHGRRPAAVRGDDGPAGQGPRRRPRRVGHRRRSGPARRSGRSRRCAGSRSPRTCRRSTASSRWAGRRPGEDARSSARTTRLYGLQKRPRSPPTGSPRQGRVRGERRARSNRRYGYARKPEGGRAEHVP